jgi:hypothetical protein
VIGAEAFAALICAVDKAGVGQTQLADPGVALACSGDFNAAYRASFMETSDPQRLSTDA